jgi:hypothetical protein
MMVKSSSNPITSLQKGISVKIVEGVIRFISQYDSEGELNVTGYTTCKFILDDREVMSCAASKYRLDSQWNDWCLVAWQEFVLYIQPTY